MRTRDITREHAEDVLGQLCRAQARIDVAAAKADLRVQAVQAKLQDDTAEDRGLIASMEPVLREYILAHRENWGTPRMRKTAVGEYGIRRSSDVRIENPDELVAWARRSGHAELFQEQPPKILKTAVRKAIEDGVQVPCASVQSSDEPRWKPHPDLVEQAKRGEL